MCIRKHFILSPHTEGSGVYEVIGYHRKRDNSVEYDVLFDDCDTPILLEAVYLLIPLPIVHLFAS
ncbi:uncharacterized protein EI90DRAFT_3136049 [Cantharellus anzutake]|uniref:uncharacterized protein n=1 Tax=Cantharellus anzutake TaxID=1750568 RepID=UPI001908A503|nr:uncharacterized protein EI90DRAFT_3136049 [Cantharellus anzutake]KAF8314377.1 hypothetical protein EI90DRAFT_3136049 [Cantharellus anzutake]